MGGLLRFILAREMKVKVYFFILHSLICQYAADKAAAFGVVCARGDG